MDKRSEARGEAMKAARAAAGLSLRDLADLSGVSAQTISRLERGVREGRVDTVELLADALSLTIDQYTGHNTIQRKGENQ